MNAQYLSIHANLDLLMNGIGIGYYNKLNKDYSYELGLKWQLNSNYYKHHTEKGQFYQNGYAKKFYEHLAVRGQIHRKILHYRKLELLFTSDIYFCWHGYRFREDFYFYDTTISNFYLLHDTTYTKPSITIQLTFGPTLKYSINSNIAIQYSVGYGGTYMNFSYTGVSLVNGNPVYDLHFTKRKRGYVNFVGIDGLPAMQFGLLYRIKRKPK